MAERAPGRQSAEERILFWHRGLATTDIAVAHLVLERAEAAGVGTILPAKLRELIPLQQTDQPR